MIVIFAASTAAFSMASWSCTKEGVGPARRSPEQASSPPPAGEQPLATVETLNKEEIAVVTRLVADFPSRAEPLALMGTALSAQGKSEEAVRWWERSLKIDPRHLGALRGLALTALRRGRFDDAVRLWRQAVEVDPTAPGVHHHLGRALLGLGRASEAAAALEKDIQVSPRAGESHFLLGQAYLQLREYEKARQSYEQAIAIRPDHTGAHYGLATVHDRLNDKEKARACRQKFRALKTRDLDARTDQIRAFDDLRSVRQSLARTLTRAGQLYAHGGRGQTAEQKWLKAASLDPENTVCRENLASLYRSSGRAGEALKRCEELREIEPRNPLRHVNLGLLYGQLERLEEAERAFRTAVQLAPQRATGYRELAELYLRAGRETAEAKTLAETAVRLEPSAASYFTLSWANDSRGNSRAALSALERAIALEPGNERYRRMYEVLRKKGE